MDAYKRASAVKSYCDKEWGREQRRARFKRETLSEVANPMGKSVGSKRKRIKAYAQREMRNRERSASAKAERWANLLMRLRLNAKRTK